ncbi:MAG: glycoside hydrolase 43 family protein [Prevotellaceae bacterium]|jgi:arabinoxylan arabinofuranohydrolase|nr:glycoside hydrolase 43 family protein [Prevotellaceae bacterium]
MNKKKNKHIRRSLFAIRCWLAGLMVALAQSSGANDGGGTFTNPVIYADVPDPDVIRVGSDFYMVSTTMHLMPGAPIMKSKDLVGWEIIGYVFDEVKDSPLYDLEGGNVYGQGQWASSLRYHGGKFYVFFATNRPQKSYLYAAENPAGKWEKVAEFDRNYHDASLLFDDDGKVYLSYVEKQVKIAELRGDLAGVKADGLRASVIDGEAQGYRGLFEGTHLCRYNGKYYIFIIWWPRGGIRTQLCFRSERIAGPYESKVILSDTLDLYGCGVAQGCIVDTEDGRWFGLLFQDHGAVGRAPVLTPCRWIDGWPMLGDENGKAPRVMEKPVQGYAAAPLVASDSFDAAALGLGWQWNHNPDNALWSLTERPGYLRLKTGKVVKSIFDARNTLSQRAEGERCSAVVAMDVSHIRSGDVAGIGAFCAEPGLISVIVENGKKFIVMTDRGSEKGRAALPQSTVYLRMDCDFGTDKATFYYSLDSERWTPLGAEFRMIYNLVHFMGNRIAIYSYATQRAGGYVDVDFFSYSKTAKQ